jgi:hypothetical protein
MRKLRARLLWEAYSDGQNMKKGKTIDPGEFQAELDKI